MTSLNVLDALPEGFLDGSACDLHQILPGPTLIELGGAGRAPLFVSILMHGNEDSGLGAMQRVLAGYRDTGLPRPLMLMIGNVAAAARGMRRLEGQPDYNRVWPGAVQDKDSSEAAVMADVHRRVMERGAFAAIDIHNNTGRNPHYSVVCVNRPEVMGLAALFAPRAVLFRGLPGTQTASFTDAVPAVTVECGQPGNEANAEAAACFVRTVLELDGLPDGVPAGARFELFHTIGVVRVKQGVALAKWAGPDWLALDPALDRLNFCAVAAGTQFGHTSEAMPIEVIDEQGRDLAAQYFRVKDGELSLSSAAVPAMLTLEERIIRQDCLCYLMEHL